MALFLVNAVGVGIFFKPILEEFKWDRATLSLVHTSTLLLFTIATPFIGRFIDHYGARITFFLCVLAQTVSSTVIGLATGMGHIFTGRFLYELKSLQASQVLVNRWFIKKKGNGTRNHGNWYAYRSAGAFTPFPVPHTCLGMAVDYVFLGGSDIHYPSTALFPDEEQTGGKRVGSRRREDFFRGKYRRDWC